MSGHQSCDEGVQMASITRSLLRCLKAKLEEIMKTTLRGINNKDKRTFTSPHKAM